jgi:hypothetical protein
MGRLAMTRASALLADLQSRGIEFETDGIRLRWRPAFLVTAQQAELVQTHRRALIDLLKCPDRIERCPVCSWPLDSALRCAKCFDRMCGGCKKLTGSYFIARCVLCGQVSPESPTVRL